VDERFRRTSGIGAFPGLRQQVVTSERHGRRTAVGQPQQHRVVVERMRDQQAGTWMCGRPGRVQSVQQPAVVDPGQGHRIRG
jgi:hypothetical protein